MDGRDAALDGAVSAALTGSGGAGVITAGNMLLEAAGADGCYGLMTRSSGPQIRGGEAVALLRLGAAPIGGHDDKLHLFAALDWENVQRFAAELRLDRDSLVLADPAAGEMPPALAAHGARLAPLPFRAIAKTIPDGRANMVALGAVAMAVGLSESAVTTAIERTLKSAKPGALAPSMAAAKAGRAAAAELRAPRRLNGNGGAPAGRWTISGSEATGVGALRAGVRFVAAYPITPATDVLEWLAPALQQLGGTLVQAEDELAAVNMIIGAAFGGTPALTATSGPGLSLMMESLGLAVAAEVPLVVVNVMRGGPSTGIPTKSEQADLNIAVYGLHGDAPHLVLAPTSVADCLFTTQWAVHLAEALQTPAIVLADQFLGQARAIIDRPPTAGFAAARALAARPPPDYGRYALTATGVSPMALPGTPAGQHTADGLTHGTRGTPSSRAEDHLAQLDKRRRKLEGFGYGDAWAVVEGDGDTAVLTWGSTTAAVREALARTRRAGLAARLIAPRLLLPAQPRRLAAALAGVKRVLVVEQSHSGQFHRYLRAHYDIGAEVKAYHRPGPLLFTPGEIAGQLLAWGGP